MHGHKQVLVELTKALKAGLTAIIQYMVQAEICDSRGYGRLGGEIKKQAIEEMRPASKSRFTSTSGRSGNPPLAAAARKNLDFFLARRSQSQFNGSSLQGRLG